MKFSIIVPVYNVEEYLDKCVDSLLHQNCDNYEILLIDDGSKDNSGKLCDSYAKKYKTIKSFHKENGGLSDARNYGLDHAKGYYVMCVDSDDWIEENVLSMIETIINDEEVDVIESRFIEKYDNKEKICDENFEEYVREGFDYDRAINWKLNVSNNIWPAPKCIYRRKFIEENKLRFLKGMLHEDVDWTANIIYKASTYKAFTKPFYYHRMGRDGSITTSIKGKNIIDCMKIANIHYKVYKENPNKINEMVINRIMTSVYIKINQVKLCNEEDKKEVIDYIKENKHLFEITPSLKYKIFVFFMKIFGVENAIKITKYIK